MPGPRGQRARRDREARRRGRAHPEDRPAERAARDGARAEALHDLVEGPVHAHLREEGQDQRAGRRGGHDGERDEDALGPALGGAPAREEADRHQRRVHDEQHEQRRRRDGAAVEEVEERPVPREDHEVGAGGGEDERAEQGGDRRAGAHGEVVLAQHLAAAEEGEGRPERQGDEGTDQRRHADTLAARRGRGEGAPLVRLRRPGGPRRKHGVPQVRRIFRAGTGRPGHHQGAPEGPPMIEDERQLQQAMDQLGRMYSALSALRADVLPKDPEMFRIMAEGPMEYIGALTREIREYSGAVEFARLDMDVWLRVEGRGIAWPDAPSSVVTAILDAFRKGVQAIAELSAVGRLTARPTAELSQMCDFPVAAFEPGSMRIGLRVPDRAAAPSLVERSVTQLLEIAAWAASEQDEADLARRFGEPSHRRDGEREPLLRRVRVTGARRTMEGRRPQTSLVVTRLDVLDEEERAREDVGPG